MSAFTLLLWISWIKICFPASSIRTYDIPFPLFDTFTNIFVYGWCVVLIYHHIAETSKFQKHFYAKKTLSIVKNVVAAALFAIFSDLGPRVGGVLASTAIHQYLLTGVLRLPSEFFDTTPVGRILSRFSKDVEVLDNSLPPQMSQAMSCLFKVYCDARLNGLFWVFYF